jgi:hypothetical protein
MVTQLPQTDPHRPFRSREESKRPSDLGFFKGQ